MERRVTYFLFLGLYTTGGTTTDRLWILMDEKTGTVEDYACRKSGEGVFFGIPRNGTRGRRMAPLPDLRAP